MGGKNAGVRLFLFGFSTVFQRPPLVAGGYSIPSSSSVSLAQELSACQRLYQALKAIDVGEYTVSHTPTATNKWQAQCSDMVTLSIRTEECQSECPSRNTPIHIRGMRESLSLFLSSRSCHHDIAVAIISDFGAIILMVTRVQLPLSCSDSFGITIKNHHSKHRSRRLVQWRQHAL